MSRIASGIALVGTGCVTDDAEPATTGAETGASSVDAGDDGSSGEETTAAGACEPTTEGLRVAVFEPTCNRMACHDASAAGGLDLSVADLESVLVQVPSGTCDGQIRVVPGDPQASFLYTKLSDAATCGAPMPVGAPLAAELVECVSTWIESVESTCETCGTDACIDVTNDPMHCGDCSTVCPVGVACVDGLCDCPDATISCDGACVDTDSDPAHCGGCGSPCDGGSVCLAGACAADCGDTLMACDGACVDVTSDAQHCGDCSTACADGETCIASACACEGAPSSYAIDIEPLLADDCAKVGCHGGVVPAEGLDLRTGSGYDEIVGVPSSQCGDRMLVEPGHPGASYLLDKVRGVDLCVGTKMPKVGPGLTAAQITAISQWICNGADP